MFIDIKGLTDRNLAEAIAELFDRVYVERKETAKELGVGKFEATSFSPSDIDRLLGESAVDRIVSETKDGPLASAAQWAVRCLAYQLIADGGLNRMKEVCSEVGEINGRAENWLDHRWNGIGGWWS